jgi:hypothetical protein
LIRGAACDIACPIWQHHALVSRIAMMNLKRLLLTLPLLFSSCQNRGETDENSPYFVIPPRLAPGAAPVRDDPGLCRGDLPAGRTVAAMVAGEPLLPALQV